ncbi:hypothetical protein BRAS3843_2490008 [Bradyrhizobium sp. STM 3843]|nr:hypothetical protein BRAS3843_2490008 [Bradyrhizobium sp. STM 3843]
MAWSFLRKELILDAPGFRQFAAPQPVGLTDRRVHGIVSSCLRKPASMGRNPLEPCAFL